MIDLLPSDERHGVKKGYVKGSIINRICDKDIGSFVQGERKTNYGDRAVLENGHYIRVFDEDY